MFFFNYFHLFFFLLLDFFVLCLILVFSIFFSFRPFASNIDLGSSYECGFIPFSDSRMKFDVQFYLVAILFVLFDIEVCLLLPFSLCVLFCNFFGVFIVFLFFLVLILGFLIEWKSGVLDLTF